MMKLEENANLMPIGGAAEPDIAQLGSETTDPP